jgi:hypothetical protein
MGNPGYGPAPLKKVVPVKQIGSIYDNVTYMQAEYLLIVAEERRKLLYTRFKDKVMYDVIYCNPDTDIEILERWKDSGGKECCTIKFEDIFGLKNKDFVYLSELEGPKIPLPIESESFWR